MQVTVIGTGYVGLVTSACLAHLGHSVVGLDNDPEKVRSLQAGRAPFFEPDLQPLLESELGKGRLRFTDQYREAIPEAEAVFICVGTPSGPDGRADMKFVQAAARSVGEHLGPHYTVLINKSTVPIGSGDWVGMLVRQGVARRATAGARPQTQAAPSGGIAVLTGPEESEVSFDVVSNPEFLREGTAIQDALNPDRIVVGVDDERAIARMKELYRPLLERNAAEGRAVPFVVMDRASAEMVKYAANAFLATKISFINEVANLCERVGANVEEVAQGIGLDRRIGSAFLRAGIGWGGSCFPKDLASLAHTAREYGCETRLLDAARDVNAAQRWIVVRKLQDQLKRIQGKTLALWGLAFKPGTDDLRDAPALEIGARLLELGAEVRAYDPEAGEAARRRDLGFDICSSALEAARDADAVVLLTEWPEFRETDWVALRDVMRRPLIVDGRNTLDRATLLWHGFEYCGVGR
ncbi:MAG: UDP-glucose/GDP-mannose dehydrogenase family protein [Armatimonadetes bacterium]|nr:UDP-glucose/GDP-mannose dehydrogenase family protein [Armatimonadota bacterium]